LYEFDIRELMSTHSANLMSTALLGSATLDETDPETWHVQLGHRNMQDLQYAVKKNLVSGVPSAVLKNKKRVHSLCDSCVRAKSTKYVRRKKARKNNLRQSAKKSIRQKSQEDVLLDPPEFLDHSDSDSGLDSVVPVGRPRDIAKAQPTSNSISILYTDLKGPFKTAGLKGEVYAQSFIEGDTKFYAVTIFRIKVKPWTTFVTFWKTDYGQKERGYLPTVQTELQSSFRESASSFWRTTEPNFYMPHLTRQRRTT
jgi:hypothetical protein